MSITKKFTLICASVLMGLSLCSLSAVNASHKKGRNHIHVTRIHKSISQTAVQDAKRDSQRFGDGYYDISLHPYYFKNKKFSHSYMKEFMKLGNKYDKSIGISMIVPSIKTTVKYLPLYRILTGNKRAGFLRELIPNGNNEVPKNKRFNVNFAKGYLFGEMYESDLQNSDGNGTRTIHRYPSINNLADYYGSGGKALAKDIINSKKAFLYHKIINLETLANKNAWTSKQTKYHYQKMMRKLHLNKYYTKQVKNLFNPYDIDGSGLTLSKGEFAANVYKHYPFHKDIYYPKTMDGGRSAGLYEGLIIYRHNNKATRQTNQAFRKYMKDYMIYHADVDCDDRPKNSKTLISYMRKFNRKYTNKNFKGSNNTSFAQWRLIYNKHQKKSSLLFLKPSYGWNFYLVKN